MYKIVNNTSFLSFNDFFFFEMPTYKLRHSSPKIRTKQSFIGKGWSESFFVRGPAYWNKLDKNITSAKSLDSFKGLLENISKDDFA